MIMKYYFLIHCNPDVCGLFGLPLQKYTHKTIQYVKSILIFIFVNMCFGVLLTIPVRPFPIFENNATYLAVTKNSFT